MGYTHYWNTQKNTILADETLIELRGALDKVLKKHNRVIQFESGVEQSPELYIVWGKGISIRFNGKGDYGHETFSFQFRSDWNFCKTARKPYDQAVCECLLIIDYYLNINVSSDGFSNQQPTDRKYVVGDKVRLKDLDGTWAKALRNTNKILGVSSYFKVNKVYGEGGIYFSYRLKS
jgi:hypothetical protein